METNRPQARRSGRGRGECLARPGESLSLLPPSRSGVPLPANHSTKAQAAKIRASCCSGGLLNEGQSVAHRHSYTIVDPSRVLNSMGLTLFRRSSPNFFIPRTLLFLVASGLLSAGRRWSRGVEHVYVDSGINLQSGLDFRSQLSSFCLLLGQFPEFAPYPREVLGTEVYFFRINIMAAV